MAPKKLTEADKTSILGLYRHPQETTSTLAERYGVSNSTISRLLKTSLPEAEYSVLIQQKRSGHDKAVVAAPTEAEPEALADPIIHDPRDPKEADVSGGIETLVEPESLPSPKAKPRGRKKASPATESLVSTALAEEPIINGLNRVDPAAVEAPASPAKPTRRRSRTPEAPAEPTVPAAAPVPEALAAESEPAPTQLSLSDPMPTSAPAKPSRPVLKSAQTTPVEDLEAAAEPDDDDWDDPVLGDDYDDDDDDSDGDDDETYPWASGDRSATPNLEALEISPLTAEVLPSLCYVVVERTSSELVVMPLRTFADLGQIPEEEGDSRTLPVFENHNVARRFSRHNQRVVKVPDGSLLQTTSAYLQAKGITRLFIDGHVFSLGPDPVGPAAPIGEE
jgi:hypothetical protein